MRQSQTDAESAEIVGITLRVVKVVTVTHAVHERAEAPTSRSASVDRAPATAAAATQAHHHELMPAPPQPSAASSTDPATLRACCRHLRAVLLQDAHSGDGVLLDTLDVAMALRRQGIRGSHVLPTVPTGSVPPSSVAADPIHLPCEGQRTVHGESLLAR